MTIVAYLKIPQWFYDCRWSISNRSDQIAGEQANPPLAFFMFFSDLGIWGFSVYIDIYIYIQISWHETNVRECRYSVYIWFTYSYVSIIYRCKSQTPMLFLHKKQLDLTVPTTRTCWTPWGQLGHCCAKSGITHGGDRMTTGCVVLKVVNGPWRGYLPTNELYELYICESIYIYIYVYLCIYIHHTLQVHCSTVYTNAVSSGQGVNRLPLWIHLADL